MRRSRSQKIEVGFNLPPNLCKSRSICQSRGNQETGAYCLQAHPDWHGLAYWIGKKWPTLPWELVLWNRKKLSDIILLLFFQAWSLSTLFHSSLYGMGGLKLRESGFLQMHLNDFSSLKFKEEIFQISPSNYSRYFVESTQPLGPLCHCQCFTFPSNF